MMIQLMEDSRYYGLKLDEARKTLALKNFRVPRQEIVLSYRRPKPESLVLERTLDRKKIRARLRRVDDSEFLLVSRGFHWINERPFNR